MPYYKDNKYFTPSKSTVFTNLYDVSTLAPISGIYSCTLCGHEIVVDKDRHLPPDGDHGCKSETTLGVALLGLQREPKKFKWRLVAAPKHRNSTASEVI